MRTPGLERSKLKGTMKLNSLIVVLVPQSLSWRIRKYRHPRQIKLKRIVKLHMTYINLRNQKKKSTTTLIEVRPRGVLLKNILIII